MARAFSDRTRRGRSLRPAVVFPTGDRFSDRQPFFRPATELFRQGRPSFSDRPASFRFVTFFGKGDRDAKFRDAIETARQRTRPAAVFSTGDRAPFFRVVAIFGDGGRHAKFRLRGRDRRPFFRPVTELFVSMRFSARAAATPNFDRFTIETARPRTRPAVVFRRGQPRCHISTVAPKKPRDRRSFFRPATELCFFCFVAFSGEGERDAKFRPFRQSNRATGVRFFDRRSFFRRGRPRCQISTVSP